MANVRQLKLVAGTTSVNLNTAPYDVVAGSWSSAGRMLEFAVLVQASGLSSLEGYIAALQRMAVRANVYDQQLQGDAVEVWTKTCDDLTFVAELGATWLRKRIRAMSIVTPDPSEQAAGQYAVRVQVSLEVEELWRRAAPESVLEGATLSALSGGGLITTAGNPITGRRIGNWASTGVAVRLFWAYYDLTTEFFAVTGTTLKAWYDAADNKFYLQDATAGTPLSISTAAVNWTAGTIHELIFIWNPVASEADIVLDGVVAATGADDYTITNADTYSLVDPPAGQAANILSAQIWAGRMIAAEAIALRAWGQPEAELPICVPPAADTNTAARYKLYNMPGDAPGALRIVLDGAAQDYAMVKAGLRSMRIPTTVAWECEAGTNGADTADAADATASGGNVAQFTPSATTHATRSTLVLAADPDDVATLAGEHRIFLACKDNAATTGINKVKWRIVVAGQAEEWSDEFSLAAVSTYSLLDLGTVRMPPGQWPAESISATTDVHAGSYITLELSLANSTGSGGGTFNLDAVYLVPAEAEGTLTGTFDVSAWYEVIDFSGERPAFIGAADYRTMEFAAWADWVGDRLDVVPLAGDAGSLALGWYRDALETWYPADTCDVFLYVEPRWRR